MALTSASKSGNRGACESRRPVISRLISAGPDFALLRSMRRTALLLIGGLFLLADPNARAATNATPLLLASGQGLIARKRQVPDDPLAGILIESGRQNQRHEPGPINAKKAHRSRVAGGHRGHGRTSDKSTRASRAGGGRSEQSHRSGTAGKASACQLAAKPGNSRDVGDLRATLAFVLLGPEEWQCPARPGHRAKARLRISVDGSGRITRVQAVSGDAGIADLAQTLAGQSIEPRPDGPTEGTVMVRFARPHRC